MHFVVKTNKQVNELLRQIQELSNDFIPEEMSLKDRRKLYNPDKIFHADFSYKDGILINYISNTKLLNSRFIKTTFNYCLQLEQGDYCIKINARLIPNAVFVWDLVHVIIVLLFCFFLRELTANCFAIFILCERLHKLLWEHIHLKQDLTAIINDDYRELFFGM